MDDLQGKTVLVTGANSGIGFIAAREFARLGAKVLLLCRDSNRGKQARSDIVAETGNNDVSLYLADFASLCEVAKAGRQIASEHPEISILCNNAGGANASREITGEGFERTLVTNHLAGFLLTKILMPSILAAARGDHARVIFTSSLGHKNSPLDFDDLNLEQGYGTLKAYGRTKLMNLLTARHLHRLHGQDSVVASSFHPGAVRTPIWKKGGFLASLIGTLMYPFMWSEEKGADTLVWLATSNDELACHAEGQYFFDRRLVAIAKFATDEAAEKLWQVSEELVAPYL